jgi:hypothetical protein
MNRDMSTPTPRGAYGYRIAGLEDGSPYLLPAAPEWPLLRIERRGVEPAGSARGSPGELQIDDSRAVAWITATDRVVVDRPSLTVNFHTRETLDDQIIVHPYLGLPVSIVSYWLGRQALHGGAFNHEGRAWALLGGREAGKSSTLGWLMRHGLEILSDDLLVLESGTLFSGPRSVDLRRDAADLFGGEDLGKLGSRWRWRLRPGRATPSTPLGGVVRLEWGEQVALEPLGADERLNLLFANAAVRPRPSEAQAYLELASLPAWRFARPRALEELDQAVPQLLEVLSQAL